MTRHFGRLAVLALMIMGLAGTALAGPLQFVRIDGPAQQYVAEQILRVAYDRIGVPVEFTPMPGARALAEATSGRRHGEAARIYELGEKQPTLIRVATPVTSIDAAVFIRKGSDLNIQTRDDLRGKRIAIRAGVLQTRKLTIDLPNVKEVKTVKQMFRLVATGRADVALISIADGLAFLQKNEMEQIELSEQTLDSSELYHYIHQSRQDIVPLIDAALKEMSETGELTRLRQTFEQAFISSL